MARRVHTSDDLGGFQGWWSSIPPVTRVLGSLWATTAVLAQIGLLPLQYLYLDAQSVFKKAQVQRQLWSGIGLKRFIVDLAAGYKFEFPWWILIALCNADALVVYLLSGTGAHIDRVQSWRIHLSCALLSAWIQSCWNAASVYENHLLFWTIGLHHHVLVVERILQSGRFNLRTRNDLSLVVETATVSQVQIKAFFLPWAMMGISMMFGASVASLIPDLTGYPQGNTTTDRVVLQALLLDMSITFSRQSILLKQVVTSSSVPYGSPGLCPNSTRPKRPSPKEAHTFLCPFPLAAFSGPGGGGFRAFGGRARRLQD